MQNWTIKKKLTVLLSSLIVLVLFNIVGMVEIAKTGYFTFLEREHLVGVETVKSNLEKIERSNNQNEITQLLDNASPNTHEKGVIQAAQFAQLQAQLCLNAVINVEVMLFNILGFGEAIEMCERELVSSGNFLSIVDNYKKGSIDKAQFFQQTKTTLEEMEYHSKRFAFLIPEIRSFMVTLIINMISVCSVLLIVAFIMVFKTLQKDLSTLCGNIGEVEKTNTLSHAKFQAGHDEVGTVSQSFAALIQKFASIVLQIQHSNNTLNSESGKLKILAEQANISVTNQFEKT